ncbi:hypothetical protein JTE90_023715 [Oedothorax gibbosus]|uniref:Ankyrin repeat and LEM domain-containing protein 2 n=1 Tax=Oedothorax gibbosus TaxID=931172 RepID=A0AAV6VBN0_9ARAC|nr:hypothetical protein JTE90_023715 [Oedothorax gibbosus]
MHLKLLEEINKLAEQFSRLSLSDEIRKLPIVNNCKNVFLYDEMYKEVNKLISVGVNKQLPTRIDVMSSSDEYMTELAISTDKILCKNLLCDDVNNNGSQTLISLSNTVSKSIMSESTILTFEAKILPKDESLLEKTCLKADDVKEHDSHSHSHGSNDTSSWFLQTPDIKPGVKSITVNSSDLEINNVAFVAEVKHINLNNSSECLSEVKFSVQKEIQPAESVKNKSNVNKIVLKKFYAVALPKDAEYPKDPHTLIYTQLRDALNSVKSWKGSRFKEFATIEDALEYASHPQENIPTKVKLEDDGSTLRSASSQELCQLRKSIERGDEIKFVNAVWNNPKILVGSCDTPSIVQEGMRYNALHIAAKSNQPYICQLILDAIENPKFLEQIYPLKTVAEREKLVHRLLDLYINTPDKKSGDTPLHYASKFGCVDCVKVLLAHPLCVPDCRNVAGFTPREIICNRLQPKSVSLIENIEAAFKGLLYVPVLRSPENDVPPFVWKPCTCREIIESTHRSGQVDSASGMSLKAFVGPMAPEIAEQFYLVLKNPSSSKVLFYDTEEMKLYDPEELKLVSKIRFSDQEKGLERIGRWLAEDLKVPWQEYFPSLNTFTNMASDDGLKSLETHLKNQVPYESNEEESLFLVHQYPSHINPLAHYVNVQLERTREKENHKEIFCTPPSSPVKNSEDCFTTPPGSPSQYGECDESQPNDNIYLQGSCVSKLDFDVLLAIGDVPVDARKYPNVSKWKSLVQSKLENIESNKLCNDSLNMLTSISLKRLHLCENICTPKRSLLNKAFCIKNTS